LRRSHDRNRPQTAIHLVSAWTSAHRRCLGQVATAAKSNEITAIPALLKRLELKGCIVTIDAMGCRTAIAEQIVAQGPGDYVLAVKDNQPQLHAAVADYFEAARASDFAARSRSAPTRRSMRVMVVAEVRRCWLVEDLRTLARAAALGRSACCIAVVEAVRAHWGVEKQLHWVSGLE
jgi:predicted transposase YbfD/YdcC